MDISAKILGMEDVLKRVGQAPGLARKSLISVMKSEGNFVRGVLKAESMSRVPVISPLTFALKKTKRSVWQILGPMMQYWVDEGNLELQVGLLQKGPRPIARRVEVMAKKHSRGYRLSVTRASQAMLSKKLLAKYKGFSKMGGWEHIGGLHTSMIPRQGYHPSKAQPTIDEVRNRQQAAMVQRIMRNFSMKMAGGRY
jgi:hypothetical protein